MTVFEFAEFLPSDLNTYEMFDFFNEIRRWCEEEIVWVTPLGMAYGIEDETQAVKFKLRWC